MSATAMNKTPHRPVLLTEVIEALAPRDGAIYVDGTFGAGGYSRALLEAAHCTVFAIDRDPDAVKGAAPLLDRYAGRLHIVQGRFGDMFELLSARGVDAVQGVDARSRRLLHAARPGGARLLVPLRQARSTCAWSAPARAPRTWSTRWRSGQLADLIFTFGEERKARRIAKRHRRRARRSRRSTRTQQLAEIVRRAIGPRARTASIPPPAPSRRCASR